MTQIRRQAHFAPARIAPFAFLVLAAIPSCAPAAASFPDPSLREMAFQHLWNEDADRAVGLFRLHLQENPDQADRPTRKGLALAYSWSGRQKEAVDLYRQLLAEDQSDTDARLGLGRSLIWQNHLRKGWGLLRQAELAPGDAGQFALTVLDEYTTPGYAAWQMSWDSDHLHILRATVLAAATTPGDLLLQTGPTVSRFWQPSWPDVTALRWQLRLQKPLRRNLSLTGLGWLDHFGSAAPLPARTEKLDWTRPGGDLWLTWLPVSRLRVDAGGSSLPVETFPALDRRIGFAQANLSCDWRLAPKVTLSGAGKLADYSDDNRRRQVLARLGWRREGRIHLWLAGSFTYLDFEIPYPGGYWAPDWVRNGSIEGAVRWRSGRLSLKVSGSLGLEKEAAANAITVGGGSARIGWRLAPDWLMAVEGGHSRSSLSTASGYRRTFTGLSIRGFF